MNYRNLIEKLANLQIGDVVIAKKAFDMGDLDFTESAKSWIGRNIISSKNLEKSNLHTFNTNDVLYICADTPVPELDCNNLKPIDIDLIGYEYFLLGSMDTRDYNYLINLQTLKDTYNYSAFSTQIIALGLQKGYLEIHQYDNLPTEIKNKIITRFMISRIRRCLHGNYYTGGGVPLLLNNYMLIEDYSLTKQGIVFSGYEYNTKTSNIYHKKIKDILVLADDIYNMRIGVTLDYSIFGTNLNGNPFDYRFDKL